MTRIEAIRAAFMDQCHKDSHGVGALFEENYRAADNVLRGDGSMVMRSGHSARDYAEGFASVMKFSSPELWAGWIVDQNKSVVGRVYKVEQEYLRIAYSAQEDHITDEQVEAFLKFCEDA